LALGHDEAGVPCVAPTYPLGVASGGLLGSADALLDLFRALWINPGLQLAAALRLATTPRAGASEDNRIGLFWHVGCVPDGDGQQATWHNESLPGCRSFLGFMPEHQIAVVVLSNAAKPVDELGGGLLAAPVH
jgi:CubicO group peptidase (beta-lactamase class C family)